MWVPSQKADEVMHPWSLFLKTLHIFSKNKETLDKVSIGSEMFQVTQNSQFYFSINHGCEVTVQMCENQYFPWFDPKVNNLSEILVQ